MDKGVYDQNYQGYEDDAIDLGEMCKYIWKKAIIILIIGVLCAAAGAGYAYMKNRSAGSYESTTSIYFSPVIDTEDAGTSLAVQKSLMEDYEEFVTSRAVIEAAIARMGLNPTYEKVSKSVSAETKGSGILEITAADDEPDMAQKLADGIAETTMECVKTYSKYSEPAILEKANLPTSMSGADRKSTKKYALIGLIAGLFVGCVAYAIIYLCSDRILSDYDIKRFLRLNTLAVVKKGEPAENAVGQIQKEVQCISVEMDTKKTDLEAYLNALKVAKENQNVIAIVYVGSHAKSVQKITDKLNAAGCKVIGAILKEA